ncbi:MAG: hypothetical protein N2053_10020, partial [Chitinispirillaceae bacterium]|nr:hypothetical protein [Chitinispirillaceae bacterium]
MRKCIHFDVCGGCSSINNEYKVQIEAKQKRLYELFSEIIKEPPQFIQSPVPYYYRHKIQLPFGRKGRNILIGCYAKDSHKIIDQKMCLLQERDCSKIIKVVREWVEKSGFSIYDENKHIGFLRHLLIRRAYGTGEILVGFVTNGEKCKSTKKLSEMLLNLIEKENLDNSRVVGIVQNVNTRRTNVVLGEKEYIWWGRPYVKELLGKWKFRIGMQTFFQVNPFQTPNLYNEVLRNIPEGAE